MDISDAVTVSDDPRARRDSPNNSGNDIDALPDDSISNVEHIVTGVLSTLGESFHDRVKVALWRVNNPRDLSDQEYLAEYLPQEFSLDKVAQDFGGGNYRAVVKVPRLDKETGMPVGNVLQIAKAPRFKIGGVAKDPSKLPALVNGQPSNMDGAIKLMMDGMAAMMDRLTVALAPKPEQPMIEKIREYAELKALLAPPITAPAADPLTAALAQISLIEKMRGIFNPVPSGGAVPENPSDNAMLLALAQSVVPAIVEAVKKDKGAVAAIAALPAPAPTPDDPDKPADPVLDAPAETPPDPEDDPMLMMKHAQELMLKAYVKGLTAQARANNDVEPVAQQVYEQATEEMWEFLKADDWLVKLAGFDPGVKLFPGWFEKLRARLLEIDKEPDEEKPE